MTTEPPWVTLHEVEMMDAELEMLWRVVFGDKPMPNRRRRAMVALWAVALKVDWSFVRTPDPPVGLVLIEGGATTPTRGNDDD